MKRPKYHFLTVETDRNGRKYVVTLPGQTFGQIPVPGGCLVKDRAKGTSVARMRKASAPGDILFTTTLRGNIRALTAADIYPLHGHGNVLLNDADEAYAAYLQSINPNE